MTDLRTPALTPNFIDGQEIAAAAGECFAKHSPATGRVLTQVARSRAADVDAAPAAARRA